MSSLLTFLTLEAINCLSLNIYHEARNQPLEGQIAVAMVTLNRVESESYPNTVCNVVWQNKQFSWTHDGKSDKPYEKEKFEEILKLVNKIAKGEIENNIPNVTHYHADYVSPCWSRDYKHVYTTGDHLFYKIQKGESCWKPRRVKL